MKLHLNLEVNALSSIEVNVKMGSLEATFKGEPDIVLKSFFEWLSKVYPSYEAISKIVFEPNLDKLIRECSELFLITDGGVVIRRSDLAAEDAIILSLVGAYVGFRLGKLGKESMTPSELARTTGKALKTIYNTLASMVKQGKINKLNGEYGLTKDQIAKFTFEVLPKIKKSTM